MVLVVKFSYYGIIRLNLKLKYLIVNYKLNSCNLIFFFLLKIKCVVID